MNLPGAGPGRPPGLPNKATQQAREAIGRFVDGNAERLQGWLDAIATGIDENGKVVGKPNPERAFELFQSVIEYHVPKLQRSDNLLKVDGQQKVEVTLKFEK